MKRTARILICIAAWLAVLCAHSHAIPSVRTVAARHGAGPGGEDLVTIKEGRIFLPQTPEGFIHDTDGNLTQDGRWNHTWDGENRLTAVETRTDINSSVPRQRIEFDYDDAGRRIAKRLLNWNAATAAFVLNKSLRFLYDGWNLVAEFESGATGPLALKRTYAWVTDLSGSEQGAGGVGGLLFVSVFPSTINSPPSTTLTPSYDGNGNVTAWLEAATGAVSAAFDYDAFGNLLAVTPRPLSSSADAIAIPVGFSTKYRDSETGTLYYGYRDYTPSLGRWTSRDPLVEKGGVNLYEFVANSTIDLVDTDGRGTFSFFEKLFGLANLADTIGDTTEVSGIVAGYVGCMKTCPDCPGMLKQCIAASNSSRLRFQADCQRAWEVCRQRCLLNSNLGGLPGKINSGIYQPIPGL